jgi:alkylhydroperoxidase/carboxymuconolactone decarboxylase family protein YurZ
VPVLIEELGDGMPELTPEQEERKAEFLRRRGYWNPFWEGLLALDTDFFNAYLEFSGVPWRKGTLSPRERELIYIAIDAATTHLYEPGLRQHIQNALGHGASREEIMEVYELTSVLGIHTCTLGVPVLLEELQTAGVA